MGSGKLIVQRRYEQKAYSSDYVPDVLRLITIMSVSDTEDRGLDPLQMSNHPTSQGRIVIASTLVTVGILTCNI